MKIANNRALAAEKKKVYNQPRVEMTQMMQNSIVLMVSPGGLPVDNTLIGDGEGGD